MDRSVVIEGIRMELKSTYLAPYRFAVQANWDSGDKDWGHYDFEFDNVRSHAQALDQACEELRVMLPEPDIAAEPAEAEIRWESFGEPRSGTGRSV